MPIDTPVLWFATPADQPLPKTTVTSWRPVAVVVIRLDAPAYNNYNNRLAAC